MLALRWGESHVRWPIDVTTASAALHVLLRPSDPGARQSLAEALSRDPPAAGWLLVQARRRGDPLPSSLDELAAWAAELGAAVWRGIESHDFAEPERAAWLERNARLVQSAQEVDASGCCSPRYLAALVRGLPPPGATIAALGDSAAVTASPPPDPLDAQVQSLPEIFARLDRLESLEQSFASTLEVEKLASLAELAAGAGHEINNPLGVITGRAELLLRGEAHPERRHDLAVIHTQALRVRTLISDLMLFARPPQLRRALTDLGALVDGVAQELQPRAQSRGVEWSIEHTSAPLVAEIDAVQIEVALRALLDNALEATPAGGRIAVTLGARGAWAQLTVADSGPGIPDEVRCHVFDPFYSGRQAGRGLGFGLAKCWRIVTLHGGTIEAASAAGEGATFLVELPFSSER